MLEITIGKQPRYETAIFICGRVHSAVVFAVQLGTVGYAARGIERTRI